MEEMKLAVGSEDPFFLVRCELETAMERYPAMASAHEGWAVILEEMDELWDEVKKSPKNRDPEAMKAEAIQLAAMAMRFLIDVCKTDIQKPT